MKKLIVIVTGLVVSFGGILYSIKQTKNKESLVKSTNTSVCVVNETDSAVTVWLTFGADTNYLTDVYGVFGIITSGMQGSFVLNAKDTAFYSDGSTKKGFSGNITFNTPPLNCPDTNLFPNGINIFECSLNNNFIQYAQETVDISCVSGVNSKIGVQLTSDNWTSADTVGIKSFENSFLYSNTFRYGVFPFGCDSCTVIVAPPICEGHKKFAQPQRRSICNIQRSAALSGGKVIVSYKGELKGEAN